MADDVPFTEEELHELYLWVDTVPISRPKKNIARDFSDGCCVAEILHHFFPKLVELHNYIPSMARAKKINNWETLNHRVLSKLYFTVSREDIEDLTAAVPGAIERFLRSLRIKISQIKAHQATLQKIPESSRGAETSSGNALLSRSREISALPTKEKVGSASHTAARSGSPKHSNPAVGSSLDTEALAYGKLLLNERSRTIAELKETVSILTEKIMKLEELIRIKDEKLTQYRSKFGKM